MQPIVSASDPAGAQVIKDSDTANFKADVIDVSMDTPVLVDFWAPWCGPCRQLTPALEKAVSGAHGKVRLVKINVDENQALAAQLRIQSIPTVYAFFQGRPVDYFMGALPDSQLKTFIDRLTGMAKTSSPIDDALAQAEELLANGEVQAAGGIYSQILEHEPDLPAAIAGLAHCLLDIGQVDEARAVLDRATEDAAKDPAIQSVRARLELVDQSASASGEVAELEARIGSNPDDNEARYDLAMARYAAGEREAAVDALLESIKRDRNWNDDAARKQLLKFFEAFGPSDPLTVSGRRRLSSILFS